MTTVSFMNETALNNFSQISTQDLNLAVNVNKKTNSLSTTKHGISIFRGSAAKTANNEARTALLKSLGDAFGLKSGISEKNGKVTFSKDFMQKLEKLIGPSFKAKDFGIPAEGGAVSSGRPLTTRRVSEIISKTKVYCGANEDFKVGVYRNKLNNIKQETGLDKIFNMKDPKAQKAAVENLNNTQKGWYTELKLYTKALDFIENFDKYVKVGDEFAFGLDIESNDKEKTPEEIEKIQDALKNYKDRIQILDEKTGEYKTVNTCGDVAKYVFNKTGATFHPENFSFEFSEMTDLKGFNNMKSYLINHFKALTKNSIDLYYTAKINDKLGCLDSYMKKPGACIEGKENELEKFEAKNFPREDKVDKATAAALKRIADTGSNEPLHKCIFAELEYMCSDPKYDSYESWEEYAPLIKEHLLNGTTHPITRVVEENGLAKLDSNGAPVVERVYENGNPAVRTLTAEEIDRDGELLYKTMFAV